MLLFYWSRFRISIEEGVAWAGRYRNSGKLVSVVIRTKYCELQYEIYE